MTGAYAGKSRAERAADEAARRVLERQEKERQERWRQQQIEAQRRRERERELQRREEQRRLAQWWSNRPTRDVRRIAETDPRKGNWPEMIRQCQSFDHFPYAVAADSKTEAVRNARKVLRARQQDRSDGGGRSGLAVLVGLVILLAAVASVGGESS